MTDPLFCVIISNVDDLKFLHAGLSEYAHLFTTISIAIGNHAWDGTPEDARAIASFKALCSCEYVNAIVTTYNVPEDADVHRKAFVKPEMYWEAHARNLALQALLTKHGIVAVKAGYTLFIDSDEILDAAAFAAFVASGEMQRSPAMKLANYWYWREPILRAKCYFEDSAVLIRGSAFIDDNDGSSSALFSNHGRHGLITTAISKGLTTSRAVRGLNGRPMLHHYSWVRTKADMLKKVSVWGHRSDRSDWKELVEKEFSGPFSGTDFLKGLSFEKVKNRFNIHLN